MTTPVIGIRRSDVELLGIGERTRSRSIPIRACREVHQKLHQ
jgi:hypothetical protein